MTSGLESRVAFRPGTPLDGEALLSVHTRAVEITSAREYGEAIARSWIFGLTADGYGQSMAAGEEFELAEADGRVVAFCGVKDDEICGLYVDPAYGGRGIGRALFRRAMSRISARGHTRIRVVASLTAVPLYREHGFGIVRHRQKRSRGGLDMQVVDMECNSRTGT